MMKTKWSKGGQVALAVILLLAVATVVSAASGGDTHGGGISPEKWKDLLYRALNFAALVAILVYFLRKPFSSGLSSRRESIAQQLEELEAGKREAEGLYRQAETRLARLDEEVKTIIVEAVKQGEAEKARIIADGERAAGDMKRQAQMAVAHELAEAKTRLKAEVAEQAVLLAEELIKKNLQPTDQNKMVEAYLEKVGGIQ
jgi:F-type H+-transporting ATPase subunit b